MSACSTCRYWKPFVPGNNFMGECLRFECVDKEQVYPNAKLSLSATISGQGKVHTEGDFFCSEHAAPDVTPCPIPGCVRIAGHPNFHCTSDHIAKREDGR